jgi:hypothetical protein
VLRHGKNDNHTREDSKMEYIPLVLLLAFGFFLKSAGYRPITRKGRSQSWSDWAGLYRKKGAVERMIEARKKKPESP